MPFAPLDPVTQLDLARQSVAELHAEAQADALAASLPQTRRGRRLQGRWRRAGNLGSRRAA